MSERSIIAPRSEIRRDLLDRPVRHYADNLTAQLHAIWRHYDVTTLDDFKSLVHGKKIPEAVVRKYRDLAARLAEVVRFGKIPEAELEGAADRAREIFGDHFLGIDEVEKAFTLQDGQQLVEFSPDEKRRALELLQEKLDEPDVRAFLEGPEDKQKNWFLILRVPYFKSDRGWSTPITARAIQERMDWDLFNMAQSGTVPKVERWYKDQKFRIKENVPTMEWRIVRDEIARPATGGIRAGLDLLTRAAEKIVDEVGFDRSKWRARSVVESFYDRVVIRRATGTKWSGSKETTTSRSDEVNLIDDAIHISAIDLRVGPSITDDYGFVVTR